MNANLTIAPLSACTIDPVYQIELETGDAHWSRTQFEKELGLSMSRFFVLKLDSNILGYGGYWKVGHEAQITNLVIASGERRQGMGYFLLTHLLDTARTEGCRQVTLEVRRRNEAARALYQKVGFVLQGKRPKAYTETPDDAILMEKTLL